MATFVTPPFPIDELDEKISDVIETIESFMADNLTEDSEPWKRLSRITDLLCQSQKELDELIEGNHLQAE